MFQRLKQVVCACVVSMMPATASAAVSGFDGIGPNGSQFFVHFEPGSFALSLLDCAAIAGVGLARRR